MKVFLNVTSSGRRGGVHSRILKLPPRSKAGNFSKSSGHFSECDVIEGGGMYSRILKLPRLDIKHETCQKRASNKEKKCMEEILEPETSL